MRLTLLLRFATAFVSAGVACAALTGGSSSGASPRAPCTRYAATGGSDAGSGTKARPFKTAQRLADSLRAGETGCLRAGNYRASSGIFVLELAHGGSLRAPLTIRSYPGERAKLVGSVDVSSTANNVRLFELDFEGLGGMNTVKIYSRNVILSDSDITNSWRGLSCLILGNNSGGGQAVRTIVRRNRFHECGSPANLNEDHAIYAANVVDAEIVNNVIYNIQAYAIQFFPNAQRVLFGHNVVDGGGPSVRGGVIFGGDESYRSNDNVVERNIVSYARTDNISSWWGGAVGKGNVARFNCVWQGQSENLDTRNGGFRSIANTVADPLFVNRAQRDFRLRRGSRCLKVIGYDTAALLRRRATGRSGR